MKKNEHTNHQRAHEIKSRQIVVVNDYRQLAIKELEDKNKKLICETQKEEFRLKKELERNNAKNKKNHGFQKG